jgi:zinc finger SWIM domain-containing protein 3
MRYAFEHYPEVMLVDSTYKTNNLRMPLYFIISVDGQGQSEIVVGF